MKIEKLLLCTFWLVAFFQIGTSQSYGIEKQGGQVSKNVLGEWQQFAYRDERWTALGIYLLDKKQGIYVMTRVDHVRGVPIFKSKPKGIFDVGLNGDKWRFKVDRGQGEIAEYRLRQIAIGSYMGWSYLNGNKVEQNVWLRIK